MPDENTDSNIFPDVRTVQQKYDDLLETLKTDILVPAQGPLVPETMVELPDVPHEYYCISCHAFTSSARFLTDCPRCHTHY